MCLMEQRPKSRRQFYILAVIFLIPMVFATIIYLRGKPFGHPTNKGTLITPPISILDFSGKKSELWRGKWTLLALAPSNCDHQCQTWLHHIRQIHRATGKRQNKVQRVLLSYHPLSRSLQKRLKKDFIGTKIVIGHRRALLSKLQHTAPQVIDLKRSSVYLVDPHGFIMMGYRPNANPSDVYKDLSHLLRVTG